MLAPECREYKFKGIVASVPTDGDPGIAIEGFGTTEDTVHLGATLILAVAKKGMEPVVIINVSVGDAGFTQLVATAIVHQLPNDFYPKVGDRVEFGLFPEVGNDQLTFLRPAHRQAHC